MPDATMWTYPWDLRDEGYDAVLYKLREEVKLDAINLASAYHTFDMLRPHLPANNTLEVSQAAIYFEPQESLYGAIKPHVSPLMQNENWWGEAAKAASSAGINLNSWTVFFHNSYQAQSHPECAEVRSTGDISNRPSALQTQTYAPLPSRFLAISFSTTASPSSNANPSPTPAGATCITTPNTVLTWVLADAISFHSASAIAVKNKQWKPISILRSYKVLSSQKSARPLIPVNPFGKP